MPLAVCDARSVDRGDFMTVRFGEGQTAMMEGTPGGFNMAFNAKHRWCYYPDMQPDEVLAFRLHDTPSALAYDATRPSSIPRQSPIPQSA